MGYVLARRAPLARLVKSAALGALIAGGLSVLAAVPSGRSAASTVQCGVERWPVKTLTDSRARLVDFTPRPASVSALRRLPRPPVLDQRVLGVETVVYRVRARLVAMKIEDDSDIHLVIADARHPSRTMIVEFPATGCTVGAARNARLRMVRARRRLERACGPADHTFRDLRGTATITGVAFFDFKHHQRGLAPNAIELHPVLSVTKIGCR